MLEGSKTLQWDCHLSRMGWHDLSRDGSGTPQTPNHYSLDRTHWTLSFTATGTLRFKLTPLSHWALKLVCQSHLFQMTPTDAHASLRAWFRLWPFGVTGTPTAIAKDTESKSSFQECRFFLCSLKNMSRQLYSPRLVVGVYLSGTLVPDAHLALWPEKSTVNQDPFNGLYQHNPSPGFPFKVTAFFLEVVLELPLYDWTRAHNLRPDHPPGMQGCLKIWCNDFCTNSKIPHPPHNLEGTKDVHPASIVPALYQFLGTQPDSLRHAPS